MLKKLLGLDETQSVVDIDVFFRGGWLLAFGLIAVAIAFAMWLYRSETRVSRRSLIGLGVCQVLALSVLIVVLLEPAAAVTMKKPYRRSMVVLVDSSSSMAIADTLQSADDVTLAARALGKLGLSEKLEADRVDPLRAELGSVRRFDLARAALAHPEIDLLKRLRESFDLRFFTFDSSLRPEAPEQLAPAGGALAPEDWLDSRDADGVTSRVGTAIDEAVARFAGQPLAGVLVFSDFTWIEGSDPTEVARKLARKGVPVHAVPIGQPRPLDIRVERVLAPEVVFRGDRVPVRVQIDSHGFDGRTIELALTIDGVPATSATIALRDGVQFEELVFTPQQASGTLTLEISVAALSGEISDANNTATHRVRILDEKIRVLYIEGVPRWEYRYLRWVLLRDPRLDVRFLMTQGDPALAATSPRHVPRFPQTAKDVQEFDLIILGDVPASYFSPADLERIEDLVRRGGGSLLMVAGPVGAPLSYAETPIAKVLPVKIGAGRWTPVSGIVHPVVTPAGVESPVVALSVSAEANERVWSKVRPMFAVPPLGGAKPGATVLLSLPESAGDLRDYPVVAWQRYGNGKSLFVATEDLWRMRLEVGDRYHARFWGQTIQFLTLSRLLGQNKQISLETERASYSSGELVGIYANVLTESFEPVLQSSYTVVVEKKDVADTAAEVELAPVPDSPGLYSGVFLAGEDGAHVLRTKPNDAGISNRTEFDIATLALEDRETAMQVDVARQVAELSGGRVLRLDELAGFPDSLGEEPELSMMVRTERDLWDAPIFFVLLVLLAGTEWFLRRRDNLV